MPQIGVENLMNRLFASQAEAAGTMSEVNRLFAQTIAERDVALAKVAELEKRLEETKGGK